VGSGLKSTRPNYLLPHNIKITQSMTFSIPYWLRVLAALLFIGVFAQKGFGQNIEELKKKAENGDAKAQVELGRALISGKNTRKDEKAGAKWIAKALAQDNWAAKYYYGVCLTYGVGVDKDPKKAVSLLNETANPKSKEGVEIVWDAYDQLIESDQFKWEDMGKNERAIAVKWIMLGAENGIPKAQCLAGEMYHEGLGVTKDLGKAAKLIRASAQSGFKEAVNFADSYEYDAMNPIQRWMADKKKEKLAQEKKKKIQEIQKRRKESEVADLLREIRDQNAELLNIAKESSEQVSSTPQYIYGNDDSSDQVRRESQDSADEIRREINQAQMWDAMQSRLHNE